MISRNGCWRSDVGVNIRYALWKYIVKFTVCFVLNKVDDENQERDERE